MTDKFIKNSLGAGPKDDDVITDSSGDLRVISRREWLAEPPSGELLKLDLPVSRVIIAHTASESCDKLVFESSSKLDDHFYTILMPLFFIISICSRTVRKK